MYILISFCVRDDHFSGMCSQGFIARVNLENVQPFRNFPLIVTMLITDIETKQYLFGFEETKN